MAEELKACRYRVEKTGYGFWPYCVRAGDGTRELFKGHQKQCMVVAAELETAFEDGKFVADRAQLPSQGGEAVEVVAYGDKQQLSALKSECSASCAVWNAPGRNREPLMTVAQHQRILAAATHPADQVAGDLTMVKASRELLQDLRDLAFDQVEHHRAAMGAYKQTRQSAMDSVLAQADALLRT